MRRLLSPSSASNHPFPSLPLPLRIFSAHFPSSSLRSLFCGHLFLSSRSPNGFSFHRRVFSHRSQRHSPRVRISPSTLRSLRPTKLLALRCLQSPLLCGMTRSLAVCHLEFPNGALSLRPPEIPPKTDDRLPKRPRHCPLSPPRGFTSHQHHANGVAHVTGRIRDSFVHRVAC